MVSGFLPPRGKAVRRSRSSFPRKVHFFRLFYQIPLRKTSLPASADLGRCPPNKGFASLVHLTGLPGPMRRCQERGGWPVRRVLPSLPTETGRKDIRPLKRGALKGPPPLRIGGVRARAFSPGTRPDAASDGTGPLSPSSTGGGALSPAGNGTVCRGATFRSGATDGYGPSSDRRGRSKDGPRGNVGFATRLFPGRMGKPALPRPLPGKWSSSLGRRFRRRRPVGQRARTSFL